MDTDKMKKVELNKTVYIIEPAILHSIFTYLNSRPYKEVCDFVNPIVGKTAVFIKEYYEKIKSTEESEVEVQS